MQFVVLADSDTTSLNIYIIQEEPYFDQIFGLILQNNVITVLNSSEVVQFRWYQEKGKKIMKEGEGVGKEKKKTEMEEKQEKCDYDWKRGIVTVVFAICCNY